MSLNRVNLWETVIINKKTASLDEVDGKSILYDAEKKYLIHLSEIEEVNVYKLDHMSFDTLVLRIITLRNEFEIPYYIEFKNYLKKGSEYEIPKFKINPIINGFLEFLNWLQSNLPSFNFVWLDENKPILDTNNIVYNYKKA